MMKVRRAVFQWMKKRKIFNKCEYQAIILNILFSTEPQIVREVWYFASSTEMIVRYLLFHIEQNVGDLRNTFSERNY